MASSRTYNPEFGQSIFDAFVRGLRGEEKFVESVKEDRMKTLFDDYEPVCGPVRAVRVTDDNMAQVALMAGGCMTEANSVSEAYITVGGFHGDLYASTGDWVILELHPDDKKIWSVAEDKVFLKSFTKMPKNP